MPDVDKSITYFNFSGGLNTETSPVNMDPNDAVDLSNIKLEEDGSIRLRPGMDFVGLKNDNTLYETTTFNQTTLYGKYTNIAPSTLVFEHTLSTGDRKKLAVALVSTDLLVYELTDVYDLTTIDTPIQTIDLSTTDNEFVHYKTDLVQNGNRIYLINPFLTHGYIEYAEAIGGFQYNIQDIYIRNLDSTGEVCSYVNNEGKLWQCIQSHRSGTDNEPGVGESADFYWTVMGPEDTTNYSAWVDSAAAGSRVALPGSYWIVNDQGEDEEITGWAIYHCKLAHTSSAANRPETGADWETYWTGGTIVGTGGVGSGGEPAPAPIWATSTGYIAQGVDTYTSNIERVVWGTEDRPIGWQTGAFSVGRFWLAGNPSKPNSLYFSQSILDPKHYNRMFQEADPFNTTDSDVVDTDGGVIVITGADRIIGLAPYRGGVVVLANNGIWYISGQAGIFKATDFSIDKISDDGLIGASSFVVAEDKVVYFGVGGVYVIDFPDISQIPKPLRISSKIDETYRSIPSINRETSLAIYNPAQRSIFYFTNFTTRDYLTNQNLKKQACQFRDVLIYNSELDAWYKYALPDDLVGSKVYITDAFIVDGGNNQTTGVISLSGDAVISESLDLVIAKDRLAAESTKVVGLMLAKKSNDNTQWAFGILEGASTQDFATSAEDVEPQVAFIDTAYQIFDDIEHNKQLPKLTTIFERVESGVIDEATGEDLTPGGCFYQVNFNWSTSTKSIKYGTPRQAYRPTRFGISYNDGSDPGLLNVVNMHSVRGRGRGAQLRFTNDGIKDFHLLGWQMQLRASKRT
jgi:hypothetical protein